MKYLVSSLLICFALVACSGSPSKEEIAEIKETESRFMAVCIAKHVRDKNFTQCHADFEAHFGYDYQQSYYKKALDELKGDS